MAASGVGQFSINVKSNLKDFYGELSRSKKTMDQLVAKKYQLEIDSKQLNELRDKAQRIAGEMRELRQQKTEIKLGIKEVENADAEIKNLDKRLASLNRQKLAVEADIQPIRTANAELYKVENEIDRINAKKVKIDVSESIKNVGNSVNKMGDGILKAFNPLTSKLNQMLGFGLVNNLVGKGLNMISSSVDGAISRVDTLNNYTKVMSNLNISQEEADKSRQRLVSGLEGLPTTLDKGVAAVQRFTSGNSDIQKSTEMFLALNNALLAGGADQNIQASALEQISQAYSKGKPDMVEWRSLLTAMPAQVAQVAQSFGVSSDELGESLRNGDRSMDEFMQRIIEMNTTGADGFKSFTEQAKNAVDGVQTGVSRMNTAVTRGVAKIITTVDEIGKSRGLGGISDMLGKIGSFFEKGLGSIADTIVKNQDAIFGFIDSTVNFLSSFDYVSFFKGLVSGLKEMGDIAKSVFNFTKPLFSLLGNGDVAEGLGKLIPRMLLFGGALKVAGLGLKVFGVGSKGIGGVFSILSKFKGFKIPSFNFGEGKGKFTTPFQNISVEQLKSIGLKLGIIAGLSANVYLAAKAIQEVTKIENMDGIYGKLASIAVAVTGMGLITIAVDKVSKLAGTSMLTGLLAIAAIAGEIYLMTLSLEKLSNVDIEFVDIQKKIGTIALVVAEIGLLSLAVGALMTTGYGAVALAAGLVAIIGIVGTLYMTAVTLDKIGSIYLDEKTIQRTIKSVMSCIEQITKYSFSSSLLNDVGTFLKNIVRMNIVKQILDISKDIEKLQSFYLDESKLKDNLNAINNSLNAITKIGEKSGILNTFTDLADYINNIIKGKIVKELIELSNDLKKLEQFDLDANMTMANIISIDNCLQQIVKLGQRTGISNIFSNLADTLVYLTDGLLLDSLLDLMSRLKNLQELKLDSSKAMSNVISIDNVLQSLYRLGKKTGLKDVFTNLADTLVFMTDGLLLDSLLELISRFHSIQNMKLDDNKIMANFISMGNILDSLNRMGKKVGIKDVFTKTADLLSYIMDTKILDSFTNISDKLKYFQNNKLDADKVMTSFISIDNVLMLLRRIGEKIGVSDAFSNLVDTLVYITDEMVIDKFIDINNKLLKIQSFNLDANKTMANIIAIDNVLTQLSKLGEKTGLIDAFTNIVDYTVKLTETMLLEILIGISNSIKRLQDIDIDDNKTMASMKAIDNVLTMLKKMGEKTGLIDAFINLNNYMVKITEDMLLDKFVDVAERIKQIQNIDIDDNAAMARMLAIGNVLDFLTQMGNKTGLTDAINNILGGIVKITENSLIDKFVVIAKEIEQLQAIKLNKKKVLDNIEIINNVIDAVSTNSFLDSLNKWINGIINVEDLKRATNVFSEFNEIAIQLDKLKGFVLDEENILNNIKIIKNALESISKLATEDLVDNLAGMDEALRSLTGTLFETYPSEFSKLGKVLAKKTNEGFKSLLDFNKEVAAKLKIVKTNEASSLGSRIATAINKTFSDRLNLTDVITKSISDALDKEYNAKINVETRSNNSTSSSSASTTTRPRPVVLASGGKVYSPSGYSRIVDSPEQPILQNGEGVVPKKIMDKIGMPFFEQLRRGQVSPTFANLGRSISNTTSSVVNNIYNNTTTNQQMNMYTTAAPDAIKIINRRLR